jgi:hypothetical protein
VCERHGADSRGKAGLIQNFALLIVNLLLKGHPLQIWELLEWTNDDMHPDASACRLKISIATGASRSQMPVPWNEREEYMKYLDHISLISCDCRLQLHEEEIFLDEVDQKDLSVQNRRSVLKLLRSKDVTSESTVVSISYPTSKLESFDTVVDDSCLKVTSTMIEGGSLSLAPYEPPTGTLYSGSIRFLNNLMDNNLSLTGVTVSGIVGTSKGFSGFILSYELLCGHLDLKILDSDSPKYLGCMLARALPLSETMKADLLSSVLRVLMRNLQVGEVLPKYSEELKKAKEAFEKANASKGSGLFGQVQGIFQRSFDSAKQGAEFLELVCKRLKEANVRSPLSEPNSDRLYCPPKSIKFVFNEAAAWDLGAYQTLFGVKVPESPEISCSQRYFKKSDGKIGHRFDEQSILALATVPLHPLGLEHLIKNVGATQQPQDIVCSNETTEEIRSNFFSKFSIQHSPACRSRNSKGIVERLAQDLELSLKIEEQKIPHELLCVSRADIKSMLNNPQATGAVEDRMRELRFALQDLHASDCNKAQECIEQFLSHMVETSSQDPESVVRATFSLAHQSGQAPYCSFEYFASLLLDSNFGEKVLSINPFLNPDVFEEGCENGKPRNDAQGLENLLVGAMLSLNRAGLAARALGNLSEILDLLGKFRSVTEADHSSVINATALKCEALSELLATRRGYTTMVSGGSDADYATYDPRFLLFEFTSNVILRHAQIALVDRFVHAFGEGRSLCHQLIMGAGKTTVIAPLLALILGTRNRLVVQVCDFLLGLPLPLRII